MKKIVFLLGCIVLFNSCKSEVDDATETPSSHINAHRTIVHELKINGNLTYINETDGKYFFADDVIISPDHFDYLKKLASGETISASKSTIAKSFARTWPDGIVYYRIPDQSTLSNANYQMFRRNLDSAFNMISSRTNIEFVERTNQPEYIHYQYSASSNDSPLGWRGSESYGRIFNIVNLYNYDIPGIIAHETMHSMGIMHEQCRPDRNQYLRVNTAGIQRTALNNFNIDPAMAGYGDFDFESVMMYGPTDFAAIPGQVIMTRLDGTLFTKQRVRLSDGDYNGINHLYGPVNNGVMGVFNLTTELDSDLNLTSQRDANDQNRINIVLSHSTANNNQRFVIRKSNHGSYIIRSTWDATKVLTVSGTANGSTVELRRNNNGNDQKWKLYNLGNDGYSLEPVNAPGLRLEVRNGQAANGALLVIGSDESNPVTGQAPNRQRFKLNKRN